MAEQVTDPPIGGTVIDLGKKVKAKYPEYANLSDEEVGRKVKAKYPDAYGGFTDAPSFQQAQPSQTTPSGAVGGPAGSGMQQGVSPDSPQIRHPQFAQATPQGEPELPESVQPVILDEAGDQVVDMPAEFLTKSKQQEAWRTVTTAPDKAARDAAHAQIKADRALRSKMDRVFAQKQEDRRLVDEQVSRDLQFSLPPQEVPSGLPEGQGPATSLLDPREQKVRADYMNTLTPEQQAYRASKQEAGQWADRDAFDEDVSSLTHAMNVLDARERRLLRKSEFRKAQQQTDTAGDVMFQDNNDVMAEAQDIDLGKQYVIERLQTAVRRHPEYASEELARKAKTLQADVNLMNPQAAAAYNVAQPIRFAIDKFAASLLTTPRTFGGAEYGRTDQLAEWAERSMENIRANEPTKFRGNIIDEDGGVNPERILPKVVETIGQAALLMGTSPTRPALLASSFVQTNGDYYKEATTRGLTHDQAKAFAWSAAALTSALEMASPNDAARQMVAGTIRREIADGLEQGLTTKEILKRASAAAGKEVLPEAGQEGGQYLGDKGVAYLANRILGGDNLDDEVKFTEFTENSLLGGVVGGLSGGVPEGLRLASIQETAANPQKVAEAAKAMGDEKAAEKVQRIVNTYEANGLPNIAPEKAAKAADAIIRKDDVRQRIKEAPMDPTLEAVQGDSRKSEEIALTLQAMTAMGIKPDKAALALAGQGMLDIPEGAKVKKMADGTVDIEVKEPKEGEKGVSKKEVQADLTKQVESILKSAGISMEEATGVDEEPTAAPTGVPEGGVPVSTEAAAAPQRIITKARLSGKNTYAHAIHLSFDATGNVPTSEDLREALKGVGEDPDAVMVHPVDFHTATSGEVNATISARTHEEAERIYKKMFGGTDPVNNKSSVERQMPLSEALSKVSRYAQAKESGNITNEGSTTPPEAPAAQASEDTGDPAGVPPAPEPAPRVEPVLTQDVPDDRVSLAAAYEQARMEHHSDMNPDYVIDGILRGAVNEESFYRFGDRNTKSGPMAKTYFAKKSSGRHMEKSGKTMDVLAQEASEATGREVTTNDLVAHMNQYRSGLPMTSDRMRELDQRHGGLYGTKLNSLVAKSILAKNKGKVPKFTPSEQAIVDRADEEGVPLEAVDDQDIEDFNNQSDEDADIMFSGGPSTTYKFDPNAKRGTEQVQSGATPEDAGAVRGDESQGTPRQEGDKERQALADQVEETKTARAKFEKDFKKRAQSLFDTGEVQTRKEAKVKKAPEPGLFEAEGDTRATGKDDFAKAVKPYDDAVASAENALADYDAQAGAREKAAGAQTTMPEATVISINEVFAKRVAHHILRKEIMSLADYYKIPYDEFSKAYSENSESEWLDWLLLEGDIAERNEIDSFKKHQFSKEVRAAFDTAKSVERLSELYPKEFGDAVRSIEILEGRPPDYLEDIVRKMALTGTLDGYQKGRWAGRQSFDIDKMLLAQARDKAMPKQAAAQQTSIDQAPATPANMTEASVINRDYRKLKEDLGEKKAKKYFEQVDRLLNPNSTRVVEYRKNGVVTESDGNRTFHALSDMDSSKWRISFTQPVEAPAQAEAPLPKKETAAEKRSRELREAERAKKEAKKEATRLADEQDAADARADESAALFKEGTIPVDEILIMHSPNEGADRKVSYRGSVGKDKSMVVIVGSGHQMAVPNEWLRGGEDFAAREAEKRKYEKEVADQLKFEQQNELEQKKTAELTNAKTYQTRNRWEIVRDGVFYHIRDPHTKEVWYKSGSLNRVREVADETTLETPTPAEVSADAQVPVASPAVETRPVQDFTESSVINRDYRKLKEELGEKKAKKYFEQVDRLFNPNSRNVVEYRKNGVVTMDNGIQTFHALSDMDSSKWRVSFTQPIQSPLPKKEGTPSVSTIAEVSRDNDKTPTQIEYKIPGWEQYTTVVRKRKGGWAMYILKDGNDYEIHGVGKEEPTAKIAASTGADRLNRNREKVEQMVGGGKFEAAARRAAAILEKAKLKGDQLYALPMPPSVWNGAIRAMQEVIIAGGKAADAIAAAIKHIQDSDWWKNKATQNEKDEVIGHLKNKEDALAAAMAAEEEAPVAPPPSKTASKQEEPQEMKKTFTTYRAYEGDFREEVREELKRGGLTRDIENQEEAEAAADAFIAKVGIGAALDAAKAGDVRGGARSVIIVRALESMERDVNTATSQEEIARLVTAQADLIQWHSQTLTQGGQEASMMGRLYQTSDLGFRSDVKADEWRKEFGEEPSPEMMAAWKERDKEFAELKEKLAEAEKRANEAEAAAALKAVQESIAREKARNKKTTPAQRSRVLADKIRTLKITQPGALRSTTMVPELWNASVEVVAQTVQAGGSLATAIQNGLNKIRESEWYKKLQQDAQQEAEDSFSSAVRNAMDEDVESGPIRVPKQMIRDAVEAGAKDIDALVAVIKEQLKEDYPDATDREIRDAITEYGKVVNLNKDELSTEVRRIKRIGRIVSALEDVANKIRPLRSGLQRDKLDAEERALNKELREALKDLPVDAEAQARELRTALDAAKTRARNRIEDLQREIDTKQRTPRSTTRIEPDAELEALIAEKEELEKEHDAIFGDKSLTEEERLKRAIDATRRSVEALSQKIRDRNVDPTKPQTVRETPELKALRERREKLREEYRKMQEEAGVIDRRRLDAAKKAAKTRIQELERRIDQGDFSKKEAKPPVVDNELIRLQAEKMRLKEEYDKEFYKHKLLNRTMPERVKDAMWEAWGLTRALQATGELSFVLMQGGSLTISNLWHKPQAVGRAFKAMADAMRSEKKSEEWLRKVKAQGWYPAAKKAKLALTEPHAELSAREELFMSDWTKILWNIVGSPLKLKSEEAYKRWTEANPFRAIERGASAYLDTLRVERFIDGMAMVEKNTGAPATEKDLSDIADVANTLTGRASMGGLEKNATFLSKLFFSPRLWASAIKTATPWAFHHFGFVPLPVWDAEAKKFRVVPSRDISPTARKMAVQDLGRFIGTTMGFVAMAAAYLNNDDDDETGVETDARSTDFGKIKIGNTYIDPWGGRIQQLVFSTRMIIGALSAVSDKPLDAYKDRKTGDLSPLGQGRTPTMIETAMRMAQNKLAPSASFVAEYMATRVKNDGTRMSFGEEYDGMKELREKMLPIYVQTVSELAQEDPGALEGFLMFYAFFGGGVNVDAPKEPKERVRPERPERPERQER